MCPLVLGVGPLKTRPIYNQKGPHLGSRYTPWHIRLEPPAPKKVFQHHRKNKSGNLFLVPGVVLDFEVALFLFEVSICSLKIVSKFICCMYSIYFASIGLVVSHFEQFVLAFHSYGYHGYTQVMGVYTQVMGGSSIMGLVDLDHICWCW